MPVFCVIPAMKTAYAAHSDVKVVTQPPHEKETQDYWQRIGTAVANSQGGFTIQLNAIPLNGVLVMRPPELNEQMDPTQRG